MFTPHLLPAALAAFSFAPLAEAYIDPGTGSLIIQGLIAAFVGSLFYVKTLVRRVKDFFRKPERSQTQARSADHGDSGKP